MTICSVLVPSRARPDRLKKTISSIWDTASRPSDVEVLVRFDDDDTVSEAAAKEIARDQRGDVRVLFGDRGAGYPSIGDFYLELANLARGRWIWIMNDDAHVTGPGWDDQLRGIRGDAIVQPEVYQLGASKYWNSMGGAFPCVPNGCWDKVGVEFLRGAAVDTWLDQILRVQNSWRTVFLSGISVVHERDTDDVLAEHRKL